MADDQVSSVQDSLKRISLSQPLDETRRASVAAALQGYRDTVSQHNLAMLRVLVDGMAEQQDEAMTDDDIEELRLDPFKEYYLGGGELPESVNVVQDLLTDAVYSELVQDYELDGVSREPIEFNSQNNWFSEMQAKVQAKASSDPPHFPPPDLRYLCTLVSGITGSRLPYSSLDNIAFINSPRLGFQDVYNHQDLDAFDPLWKTWDIRVACRLGQGPRDHSGSAAIFCRNVSKAKGWSWRYGIFDEGWHSPLFDTIEGFLAWYAHFREQTAEEVEEQIEII